MADAHPLNSFPKARKHSRVQQPIQGQILEIPGIEAQDPQGSRVGKTKTTRRIHGDDAQGTRFHQSAITPLRFLEPFPGARGQPLLQVQEALKHLVERSGKGPEFGERKGLLPDKARRRSFRQFLGMAHQGLQRLVDAAVDHETHKACGGHGQHV
jgi:hypothetical protein